MRLPRQGVARFRSVSLWAARPLATPARPLVLHLTGDSGLHGLDLLLFTELTRWGYPVAVLSSPGLAATSPEGETTPHDLAIDLNVAARAAGEALGLPAGAPFVLLGQSRGAGLAVEAAGDPALEGRLLGVIALGLCREERRVRRERGFGLPYRDRSRLAGLPLEVIQSTRDGFFAAAEARAAFGPDGDRQRFHAVEARSHTFVGNREGLLRQLRGSLARVAR